MATRTPTRSRRPRLAAALLLAGLGTAAAVAQPPAAAPPAAGPPPVVTPLPPPARLPDPTAPPHCPPANAGFPERLPAVPDARPRPAAGPGSVAEFVEGVSHNDAAFEVVASQGRILTTRTDIAVRGRPAALVAVGDPTVADFAVVSARQIRVEGRRLGVTDLSIITPDNQAYTFEVRVVADLHVLRGQLHCLFPDASVRLSQVRDHVVVEGQARDTAQVARIMEVVQAYLVSVQTGQGRQVSAQQGARGAGNAAGQPQPQPGDQPPGQPEQPGVASPERSPIRSTQATIPLPRVINLLKVPGSKQVLLKVRVAELNRTAFRQVGADLLATGAGGSILGTQIGGGGVSAGVSAGGGALSGFAQLVSGTSTTAFGIFEKGDFAVLLSALRRNSMLKILAEPNLVALNGHAANFLAGGEFPIPVPQGGGGAGGGQAVTVQFREFGVRLGFLPFILDGDLIRLSVDPEVSTIDPTLGTVLVPGGTPVPGLNTRRAHTVVEMREGQTLAIAGLLQLTMDGSTQRIPGLGDLAVIGPFFSNTTGNRVEKELIVLVTPHLVDPLNCDQVPPPPGAGVTTPSDFELYFLNRIEGRTGTDWRVTTQYEKQLPKVRALLKLDAANVRGPCGFCD